MKDKNNLLAIAIPTYNRASILQENLLLMLDEIKKFAIPIYISDDSPNSETEEMISELKITYPYIYYKKNSPSLGHDKNCISTLKFPDEKYVWYLGDSVIIKRGGIERIVSLIEKDFPRIIAINSDGRNLNIETKVYFDGNSLLEDLAWHLTMTGATIYSKQMLNHINLIDLSICKNFPQLALIFKCFAVDNCNLFWENNKLIYSNIHKKSYWDKNVFNVFFTDWTNCINNLDNKFSKKSKQIAILSHSRNSGIFNFKSIIHYKYKGFFSWREYFQYFKMLKNHSSVNIFLLVIIVLIPRFLISAIVFMYDSFKHKD